MIYYQKTWDKINSPDGHIIGVPEGEETEIHWPRSWSAPGTRNVKESPSRLIIINSYLCGYVSKSLLASLVVDLLLKCNCFQPITSFVSLYASPHPHNSNCSHRELPLFPLGGIEWMCNYVCFFSKPTKIRLSLIAMCQSFILETKKQGKKTTQTCKPSCMLPSGTWVRPDRVQSQAAKVPTKNTIFHSQSAMSLEVMSWAKWQIRRSGSCY